MKNVRIKNKTGQRLRVTLSEQKKPVEVILDPYGALPDRRRPQEISGEAVTPYTQGLADKGFISITEARPAHKATSRKEPVAVASDDYVIED